MCCDEVEERKEKELEIAPYFSMDRGSPNKKPFSKGGFCGFPSKVLHSLSAQESLRCRSEASVKRQLKFHKQEDRDLITLVSVPTEGWEREKAQRVEVAFQRILQREWWDKFEGNMKLVDQIHINAVREHYALKRDKIKTPALIATRKSNTMNAMDWAANMEAVQRLNGGTGLQQHFLKMARKKSQKSTVIGEKEEKKGRDLSDVAA